MRIVLSFLIVAAAIINIVIGIGFFVNPGTAAGDFGLTADTIDGLSTLRADMTAFFLVAAGFMIWGAWKQRGDLFLVPIALFGIAFIGRALNLAIHGTYDFWYFPMAVEAAHVVVLAYARLALPHRRVAETGGA